MESKPDKSLRQQAFQLFDYGLQPGELTRELAIKTQTAFTYHQQWKRLPPFFGLKYRIARALFRQISDRDRRNIARYLAVELGSTEDQVLACMRSPWAVKQIVTGEWRQWPVEKTPRRGRLLAEGMKSLRTLGHSRGVKDILELAMNPEWDPMEGLGRDIDLIAEDGSFFPKWFSVHAGDEVTLTFDNRDSGKHRFTILDERSDGNGIVYRTKLMATGTHQFRFAAPSEPGTYLFLCDEHPEAMAGRFIVTKSRRQRRSRRANPTSEVIDPGGPSPVSAAGNSRRAKAMDTQNRPRDNSGGEESGRHDIVWGIRVPESVRSRWTKSAKTMGIPTNRLVLFVLENWSLQYGASLRDPNKRRKLADYINLKYLKGNLK